MFRNLKDDEGGFVHGFVNGGLEINEENGKVQNSNGFKSNGSSVTRIEITRSPYDQKTLNSEMSYKKPASKSILSSHFEKCSKDSAKSCFFGTFPIISWLSSYKKSDFVGDLISGITVAVMHIPQGMGYALLANLPPIVGIYMAFFPVLLYIVFGTSRHNSMGTFAVVSIMVGRVVNKYSTIQPAISNATDTEFYESPAIYSPVEVATLVCFIVGVIQLLMYIFRLGILSFLLSECLVSGFTTGAAIHVLTSQVKDLLGLELPRVTGNFKLIKTYIEIFNAISSTNQVAILMSAITIAILLFNNEYLKPKVSKISKVPIPIELIVVIGGVLLSKYLKVKETWDIVPVGEIPVGLPEVVVPKFNLLSELIVDSFAIAFVSYSVTVSMALIFGQKLNYEINFNQELLAMGIGNIFGSFFSCMPFSASLSRSLIQQSVGGKTQLTSLFSCILLLFVLLWIGPFFEVLPRCILASVVVVALKGMLMQFTEFPRFKKKSKMDAFVWIATLLAVVIISIDIGLLIGIILSISCIFYNSLKADMFILGRIPNTDFFLDINRFEKAKEIPDVKIINYRGSINFATKASFKNRLCNELKINLLKELKYAGKVTGKSFISNLTFKHLVLDFSALSYIDSSSITMISNLVKSFQKLDVKISITGCSSSIFEVLIRNEFIYMDVLFPTIQDAIYS